MLEWAFVVLGLATIAAAYGYAGAVSTSTYIAKLFFIVLLFVFLMLVVFSLFSSVPPPQENTKLPL